MNQTRVAIMALACSAVPAASAQDFREFNTSGLPRSEGLVVRVQHPSAWKQVASGDEMALAELRGPYGKVTGILQIGRGVRRDDMAALCKPENARTMLRSLDPQERDARVTDVFARKHQGRPAYELRYERNNAPTFTLVRSVIVCLKNSKLLVSCGAVGPMKSAVAEIEPVCRRVLESLTVAED
jgi:hypothetical protein